MANGETNTVIVGAMLSGKSTELIQARNRWLLGGLEVEALVPALNVRNQTRISFENDGKDGFIEARLGVKDEIIRIPAERIISLGKAVTKIVSMLPHKRPDHVVLDELQFLHPEDIRRSIPRLQKMKIGFMATSIARGTNLRLQPSLEAAMEVGLLVKELLAVCVYCDKTSSTKYQAVHTILRGPSGQPIFDGPDIIMDTKGSGLDTVQFSFEPACVDCKNKIIEEEETTSFPQALRNSDLNFNWEDRPFNETD